MHPDDGQHLAVCPFVIVLVKLLHFESIKADLSSMSSQYETSTC